MPNNATACNAAPAPRRLTPLEAFERELTAFNVIQADRLYTVGETAVILRVSRRTLERWRREGRGPGVTRLWEGGRPLYRGKHILEALDGAGR